MRPILTFAFAWFAGSLSCAFASEDFIAGRLFVSDRGTERVLEYASSGELIHAWGAGEEGFAAPWGVAFGPDGRLYVSCANGDLFVFDGAGGTARVLADGSRVDPRGITFGPDGRLFVASGGNDSIVVLGPDLVTERVEVCPAGRGKPTALAFDRRGRLWVASEESSSTYVFDLDSGAASSEVALPAPASDLSFYGGWQMAVAIPSLDQVHIADALNGVLLGVSYEPSEPTAYTPLHDGSRLIVARGTQEVLRPGYGPFGLVEYGGPPEMTDPVDATQAPWRFDVKLKGHGYTKDLEGPLSKRGRKVHEDAVLSLHPGTDQVFLELDATGDLASDAWFGVESVVLQGGGWQFFTDGELGSSFSYRQTDRTISTAVEADAILHRILRDKKKSYDDVIADLSGRIHLSKYTLDEFVTLKAKIASKGPRNKN